MKQEDQDRRAMWVLIGLSIAMMAISLALYFMRAYY